jgi:DNA polymerase III alpha subunit (gram-positive type)
MGRFDALGVGVAIPWGRRGPRGRPLRRVRIDLHLHSTASDGMYLAREVVARARAGALDIIALADHDTVGGVPEATTAAAGRISGDPGH